MQCRAQFFYLSLMLATLSGCASSMGGQVDGRADALSPEERRLQALETKMAQMQRRLDALNTTRFDEDNQRLKDDMRTLRGDVEKTRFDYTQQDRRGKDLYMDLDRRLQRLEAGGVAAAAAATAPVSAYAPPVPAGPTSAYTPPSATTAPAVAGAAVVVSPQVGSPEEEGAYLATFDLLKNGKYDDAIRGFGDMLDKWPNGRYADNAAYWMGEANYVKRDYSAALTAFQRVLKSYPNSAKTPDAMLKIGLTYTELKQPDLAKSAFQQLVQKYPNSNAAKLATQRLNAAAPKS